MGPSFQIPHLVSGGLITNYNCPSKCRHCLYPPCKIAGDEKSEDAIFIDPSTRAVIFDPAVKISPEHFKKIRAICPFDIPRYDAEKGRIAKCTMCFDRVGNGLLPACVKACPTGAMNFGGREAIQKMADKRLYEVKEVHERASLVNPEAVRVIFLLADYPETYHRFAEGNEDVGITRMMAIKRLVHPVAHLKNLMG